MQKKRPLVTIITVAYNAESTIGTTMRSVASQTFTDYEHIVIDGASKDNTLAVAKDESTERTNIFSEPDKGIYDAMNKGLAKSAGQYVLFLNAGDSFATTTTIQRFAEAASQNVSPDIIYGQTVLVDDSGKVVGKRHLTAPEKLDFKSFRKGMLVCHQAFMVKRDIAQKYDTQYKFSADYEWCLRCLQLAKNNVYLGEEPVIHYLHEGLTTRNHKASLKERYKIMCRYYGTIPTMFRHIGFAFRHLFNS